MQLSWKISTLNFKNKFAIAHGSYSFRNALIVTLNYKNFSGYGEATIIDYYHITSDKLLVQIKTIQHQIEKRRITSPIDFYIFLKTLSISSFLMSALDCAYWDLFGKLENKSFLELNSIVVSKLPKSSITISIASVEDQIKEIEKSDWTSFKIKVNSFNSSDLNKLQTLDYSIAIDANASFSGSDCKEMELLSKSNPFLYVEQPMQVGFQNYSNLSVLDATNWMADEDFQSENNLPSLQNHYQSINIKLLKCGGLTPALGIIKAAKNLNYKIMIGCMTESTIGISAAAMLSPFCDFADLDGANLIANDLANGSKIENGIIKISEKPGLGIDLI